MKLFSIFLLFTCCAAQADGPVSLDGKITAITSKQVVIQSGQKIYILNRAMVSPSLEPQIIQRPTHFIVQVQPGGIQSVKPMAPNRAIASDRAITVE